MNGAACKVARDGLALLQRDCLLAGSCSLVEILRCLDSRAAAGQHYYKPDQKRANREADSDAALPGLLIPLVLGRMRAR